MSVRHVAARLAGSCSTCENVRTAWKAEQYGSESSQGPHWVPYTDLALAAQSDCQICHVIFGAISLYRSRFQHIDPESLMVHLPHHFDRGLLQLCNGEQTPSDRSHLSPEAILAPRDSDASQPILELKLFARENHWFDMELEAHNKTFQHSKSQACLDVIKRWLKDCSQVHPMCQRLSLSPHKFSSPDRLVDLGRPGCQRLRLVTLDNLRLQHSEQVKYTALSYCWGKTWIPKTTSTNLEDHLQDISWKSLPKTYRDAVWLTRDLGLRYIWIDSLCILQDDTEIGKLDWQAQTRQMGSIYEYAHLVIAADLARNSDFGFFFARANYAQTITVPLHKKFAGGLDELYVEEHDAAFIRMGHFLGNLKTSLKDHKPEPVWSRGWCFQERMLASRVLHFTSHELVWECKTGASCECGHVAPGDVNGPAATLKRDFEAARRIDSDSTASIWAWWSIVSAFSYCLLSVKTDRLPAISGAARQVQTQDLGPYFAGLWREDMPRALLWRSARSPGSHCERPEPYVAPTWSWASIDGPVDPPHKTQSWNLDSSTGSIGSNDGQTEESTTNTDHKTSTVDSESLDIVKEINIAKIVDVHCKTDGEVDPFVQVLDGWLKLQAPVARARVRRNDQMDAWPSLFSESDIQIGSHHVFLDLSSDEAMVWDSDIQYDVLCVLLCHGCMYGIGALLLRPSTRVSGAYERVGIVDVHDKVRFEDWPVETLTIV